MHEAQRFALLVAIVAGVGLLAVLSNRVTSLLRVPAAALFLVAAAVAARVVQPLHAPPQHVVEDLVTVALVVILFDGGLHLGWKRVRATGPTILALGLVGTFFTAGAAATLLHVAFGLDWYVALLIGTAVAPTDPAVVFSVLGQREILGNSGSVLEGESGANDPVGIALLGSLLMAGKLDGGAVLSVGGQFLEQMAIGAAVGLLGGWLLLQATRWLSLSSESLYSLLVLGGIQLIYGLTTYGHGSGFLAVFVVGILFGDARAPYKIEIVRFHGALASLGEIVAFVVLGLTIDVGMLGHTNVWVPGVVLGVVLALVIRPVFGGLTLLGSRLNLRERGFVLFVGLKGAVPILLGTLIFASGLPDAERYYLIVVVVVVVSVVGQGTLVPTVGRLLKVPMRETPPEPFIFGTRLEAEPQGARRYTVDSGSPADGTTIGDLDELGQRAWVSFVIRRGELVAAKSDTRLESGDEVMLLVDPNDDVEPGDAFARR